MIVPQAKYAMTKVWTSVGRIFLKMIVIKLVYSDHHGNITIVTMRRVAIIFFKLGVVKNFMQNFNRETIIFYFFV